MSVEAHVIAAIVTEGVGGLRKTYQHGVSAQDFVSYEEEFGWIEQRASARLPISRRTFMRKFPDFEMLVVDERLQDLLPDLKNERAFTEITALMDTLGEELEVENAVQKAQAARDILGQITRQHSQASDHLLVSGWRDHYEEQKRLRRLRDAGEPPGIPTGYKWIDHHWDGLVNGRMIVILARPGQSKSYFTTGLGANSVIRKYRVVMFSPEMNRHEHTCRFHTILSAMPEVKEAVGLEHSFRNRALMSGIGYPMKTYKRFMEYVEGECGEFILLTKTNNLTRMTTGYIEAKIDGLNPDVVIIDPIYFLNASQKRYSRTEEISDMSQHIASMAETYNIPIIVTNQAHRQMTGKDDAPGMDTSFNSDVPVQGADHVIGLRHMSEERKLIVKCSKSRFGQSFRFELDFFPNTGVMRETNEPSGSYMNGKDDEVEDEEMTKIIEGAVAPKPVGVKRKKGVTK
jgi:hypothetical protein